MSWVLLISIIGIGAVAPIFYVICIYPKTIKNTKENYIIPTKPVRCSERDKQIYMPGWNYSIDEEEEEQNKQYRIIMEKEALHHKKIIQWMDEELEKFKRKNNIK